MLVGSLWAFRDGFELELELEISPEEIIAVVGPNGAGKSTMLRVLAGLLPLHSGRLTVDGQVWENTTDGTRLPAEMRDIGFVPQTGLLFPHLTVLENVLFGLAGDRQAARESLARFGLESLAQLRPDQLSGGQAQLVSFARAQARHPAVLLLDEPLASVDAPNRAAVRRIIRRELRDTPGYRILVTHDPLEAAALADRVIVLDSGRVTQVGTIDELRSRPRSRYVAELVGMNFFSGEAAAGTITLENGSHLVSASVPDGAAMATVHPRAISLYFERPSGSPRNVWLGTIASIEPSLEQVRIHLTGPIDVVAEVTRAGAEAFSEGDPVWAAIKASEVSGYPR